MGRPKFQYIFIWKETDGDPEQIVMQLIEETVQNVLLQQNCKCRSEDTDDLA